MRSVQEYLKGLDKDKLINLYIEVHGDEYITDPELADIRVSVVYDQGEESECNARMSMTANSASDDSRSATLSPYMRYAFERALGLDGSEND